MLGRVVSGKVKKNDILFLGPDKKQRFFEIRIEEVRIDDKEVPFAKPGQMSTLSFGFTLNQENER